MNINQMVEALTSPPLKPKGNSMNIDLNQARIDEDTDQGVTLWSVRGLDGWWPTKIVAEVAARRAFPEEAGEIRYARVFYSTFYRP